MDILHNAFMKFYIMLLKGNIREYRAYLYKVVINEYKRFLYKNKMGNEYVEEYSLHRQNQIIEMEEKKEKIFLLKQSLSILSDREKEALILRLNNFSYKEISSILSTTTEYVRKLISRAVYKLNKHLGGEK